MFSLSKDENEITLIILIILIFFFFNYANVDSWYVKSRDINLPRAVQRNFQNLFDSKSGSAKLLKYVGRKNSFAI